MRELDQAELLQQGRQVHAEPSAVALAQAINEPRHEPGGSRRGRRHGAAIVQREPRFLDLERRVRGKPAVKAELCRVRPGHIVVMGGINAISDAVYDDVAQCALNGSIHREPGTNRYDTAARVSANTFKNGAPVVINNTVQPANEPNPQPRQEQ